METKNQNDNPVQLTQHRAIVYAVVTLSFTAVLGYVLLSFFGETPPESLANIAIGGMGILGGMAMPQRES